MKLLFEMIERMIRGEYDSQMRQEHMLTVNMDLKKVEENVEEE